MRRWRKKRQDATECTIWWKKNWDLKTFHLLPILNSSFEKLVLLSFNVRSISSWYLFLRHNIHTLLIPSMWWLFFTSCLLYATLFEKLSCASEQGLNENFVNQVQWFLLDSNWHSFNENSWKNTHIQCQFIEGLSMFGKFIGRCILMIVCRIILS